MAEAIDWPKDKLVVFCVSSSNALMNKSKKLGCPVIEYWVRAVRDTRMGSTSVSRGYGKKNIFGDHDCNGEHKQKCKGTSLAPCL